MPSEFLAKRVQLLRPRLEFVAPLHQAIIVSQKELAPWLHWASPLPTGGMIESYVLEAQRRFLAKEEFLYLLVLRSTPQPLVIGGLGVHRIDWQIPKAELGYWLHSDYTGYGYMKEAAECLIEPLFSVLGFQRLEIRCSSKNIKSQQLAQRLSFVHEATLAQDRREVSGELGDTVIFSRLAQVSS